MPRSAVPERVGTDPPHDATDEPALLHPRMEHICPTAAVLPNTETAKETKPRSQAASMVLWHDQTTWPRTHRTPTPQVHAEPAIDRPTPDHIVDTTPRCS